MDRVLIYFGAATLVAYIITGMLKPEHAASGLDFTADMFLQAAPWIIVSMFAAGLLSQLLNPKFVASLLGQDSGFRGVLIGATLGLFGTGSRWAAYPLAAGLIAAEASPGSVFAFLTTWQLVSLPRLPAEVPFLGLRFTVLRAVLSYVIALAGGLVIDKIG